MNRPVRVSFLAAVVSILALSTAPAEAASCRPCEVAHERCFANCFGLAEGEIGGCFVGCNNEAAICSCDEPVTLSSEDFLANFSPPVTTQSQACHSTTPCGSEYGSCGSWSSYVPCGDPICRNFVQGCGACGPEDPCIGPGLQESLERYRVCFNAQQQACTEYQRTSWITQCDC